MSDAEGFGAITTLAVVDDTMVLVEEIGGPETPGIGFAMSIERLLLLLKPKKLNLR